MSATLGSAGLDPSGTPGAVPAATRTRPPGWRDPRMWVGIALVAASVVAGARIIGAADDTVQVWAVGSDLAAGQELTADDLVATGVHFADPAEREHYLLAEDPLPADATLGRAVGAGELLASTALRVSGGPGVATLPLVLPTLAIPPGLSPGSRVDVWSVNERAEGYRARVVLEDVEVVAVPAGAEGFGASLEQQLLLGIRPGQQEAVGDALESAADGSLTVQKRG